MKKRHAQWIKHFYRWTGHHVARAAYPTPLTANGLTFLRLPSVLGAAWLIATATAWWLMALAAFLVFLFSMLDAADGELARLKGTSMVGAWMDIQIDQVGFLVLFVALGWRLSWVPEGGIVWILATVATLGMLQTVAQLPWFLRHKDVFDPIVPEAGEGGEEAARVGRDPAWMVFKQQVRPHYHNYSLLVIAGLLAGSARLAILLLGSYTAFWWVWIAGRVFAAAARHDRRRREQKVRDVPVPEAERGAF